MTFSIRSAETKDADAVARILSAFIDETAWMPRIHTHAEDRKFGAFLIEKTEVRVADSGGVVGFIACRDQVVQALYVDVDHRGKGIGSKLLNDAKTNVDGLGLWTFQANKNARKFYANHGFVEGQMTSGERNDEGIPDVFMTWKKRGP